MNIAVIGWGSLIWCPGSLNIKSRWRDDGPRLPIEFARVSKGGHVTLVILPGAEDQGTYWALSGFDNLVQARENLSAREGSSLSKAHFATQDEGETNAPPDIAERVRIWLSTQPDLESVIWTGLECNWAEKQGESFSPTTAAAYLKALERLEGTQRQVHDRAREYVTNAPSLIDTAVRRSMRSHGWKDAVLSPVLFESEIEPS